MDAKHLRPEPEYFEQMALGLELDEADRSETGFVSPQEAALRSSTARAAFALAGLEQAPTWFEQYRQLLNAGWPWRVACYIAWAASPRRNRWPKTQEQLATDVLGLTSDRQIGTWRKRNPAIDDVISTLQAAPLMERRADVLLALAEAASDSDHRNNPDRKLYLEITGDYVPRQKVDLRTAGDVDDLAQLDERELKQMEAELQRKLGRRDEEPNGTSD